jgi:DNA polymerase V
MTHTDMYAIADCNNFYVSCERVFDPYLNNKPVAILSNNDGCVIARSNELKQLGVPMGAPLFEWKDIFEKNKVQLRSANFTLYQDMSQRIYNCLQEFCEQIEVYSIDEAFLRFGSFEATRLISHCRVIKDKVYKWTGIPISIGIAYTKTLCKLANKISKKFPENQGVFLIDRLLDSKNASYLTHLDISDIWGIGFRITPRLKILDVYTISDFLNSSRHLLKQEFGVGVERTWLELNGVRCYPIKPSRSFKQSILCSRTFRHPRHHYDEILRAISSYTDSAGRTLRSQHSVAGSIGVFLQTSRHTNLGFYHNFRSIKMDTPTSYTPTLIINANKALEIIYKPDYKYKRAGVLLTDICSEKEFQQNIFVHLDSGQIKKNNNLMQAMDGLNSFWGVGTIKFGTQQLGTGSYIEQTMRSARYTTNWLELLSVPTK